MSGGGCFSGILQPVLFESQEDRQQIALKPRFEYTQLGSCKNTAGQAAMLVWQVQKEGDWVTVEKSSSLSTRAHKLLKQLLLQR